jgi:hypothetical protein
LRFDNQAGRRIAYETRRGERREDNVCETRQGALSKTGVFTLERKNNPLLLKLGLDENFVIPLGYESSCVIGGRNGGRKGGAKTTALYGIARCLPPAPLPQRY